ncbi:MAG: class I SAM-dependent methyltransferase [Candidatus Omnitrophica bacterium]|nr:class I SAM-dependent methyltransferase [Candidatus Omnitrophota bacterium]
MKIKYYTKGHNLDLLRQVDNKGEIFSAEEHAYVMEKEFADRFKSREGLLFWALSGDGKRLSDIGFLMDYINKKGFTNILSLGAGNCISEYLLRFGLPGNSKVVAADFDPYLIDKAKELLPGITPVRFDFFKDDVREIKDKLLPGGIDLAVFLGSSYVMDDDNFILLFKRLKEIGCKEIMDFQGGVICLDKLFNSYLLWPLKESSFIRMMLGKPLVKKDSYKGKFSGYLRSRGECRRLYKKAGLRIFKELSAGSYRYVSILHGNP